MSIKILIDMNLSPDWVPLLQDAGWQATHWSTVGDPKATDRSIMDWAEANGYVVFTHDLDFGTTLALTHKTGPSVLQVRGQDVLPDHMGNLVIAALNQHGSELESGALAVVEKSKNRYHPEAACEPGRGPHDRLGCGRLVPALDCRRGRREGSSGLDEREHAESLTSIELSLSSAPKIETSRAGNGIIAQIMSGPAISPPAHLRDQKVNSQGVTGCFCRDLAFAGFFFAVGCAAVLAAN